MTRQRFCAGIGPGTVWSDGTGQAACGSTAEHGAHMYADTPRQTQLPAWRRRALDPETARAADLTGSIRP